MPKPTKVEEKKKEEEEIEIKTEKTPRTDYYFRRHVRDRLESDPIRKRVG